MESVKNYVHLLGDSTLDNLFWLMRADPEDPHGALALKGS